MTAISDSRIELLQQMPIFGGATRDTLQFLLERARVVEVSAYLFFFHEDDPASAMFVLESGRVAVRKRWNLDELELRELGPGDCFGEMALLDFFPRSASVIALSDCIALELTPDNLYRLFERDAAQFALIQMNVAREMSRRLRVTDELLFKTKMAQSQVSLADMFRLA